MRRAGALAALIAVAAPAQAPPGRVDFDGETAALVSAKRAAADAEARAAALTEESKQAGDEASRARAHAAALDLRVKAAEADMAAARARIALIASLQDQERRRLAEKRGPIVRLLAALQTMARRPPALALAQPGSAADIVHVRLLLADTLPVIEERTATLRAGLARQTELRADAEKAAGALDASRVLLGQRRKELAEVEATAIRKSQRLADQAAQEAERALALGEESRDIADRMQSLSDAGDVRASLARLSGPTPRPAGDGDAMPGHDGAARFILPASGDVATGFGEVSPAGVRARGLTLVTAPSARVVAPHAGRVAFAAPFRSYGRIVILVHGGGWTTTITGLDTLGVKPGQWVRLGAAIGKAGTDSPHVTTELRRGTRPVDVLAIAQAG